MIGYPSPDSVASPAPPTGPPDEPAALVARLRLRIEQLERITLLEAVQNEALADQVERLTVENERLRRPHGVRAALARGWHHLDT